MREPWLLFLSCVIFCVELALLGLSAAVWAAMHWGVF